MILQIIIIEILFLLIIIGIILVFDYYFQVKKLELKLLETEVLLQKIENLNNKIDEDEYKA